MPSYVVTIDEFWLTFIVSVALPMVTALVKRRCSASWVGAVILLGLSAITGFATSLYATGGVFELKAALVAIVLSFITAAGFHYGLLKPAGVTGDNGAILKTVPGGVGRPVAEVEYQPKAPISAP